MAVESPVYINEFNEAWPDGLDTKSQGDDHIRNIKGAIKRTFPNVSGVVSATHSDLSKVGQPGYLVSPGCVMLWPYSLETVPAGWKVCNGVGTISTGQAVPNMNGRFAIGAGTDYSVGSRGGSLTHQHNATTTVAGHRLTIDQLPPHSHPIPFGTNDTTGTGWNQVSPGNSGGSNTTSYTKATQNTGGNNTHNHGATTTITQTIHLPLYQAMFYIIKD